MKKLLCITTAIVVFSLSQNLFAAPDDKGFSQRGHSVVVVDHLFGLTYYRDSSSASDSSGWMVSVGSTNIGDKFFGSRRLSSPRLGYHYFFGDSGVSAGLGITYLNTSSGSSDTTGYSFAPRLGYATSFSPTVALWLRSGITLGKTWDKHDTLTATAWGSELQLVITPTSHFGLMIGPMAEIGLSGKYKRDWGSIYKDDVDAVPTLFGLTLGVLADF